MDKNNTEEQPQPSPWYTLTPQMVCLICAIVLVVIGFVIAMLWKAVPKMSRGGRRWGSKGGCGCLMP